MKKHFQLLFTLFSLFLLNGNGFLYATTYEHLDLSLVENIEKINNVHFKFVEGNNLEKQSVENSAKNSFSNDTNFYDSISLSKTYPIKNKHTEVEFSNFVKKEEKLKPIYFEKDSKIKTEFVSFYQSFSFSDFYYSKKPRLANYFKCFLSYTYKRYLLLQVFRI